LDEDIGRRNAGINSIAYRYCIGKPRRLGRVLLFYDYSIRWLHD
jgi:hypothetical protein